MRGSSSPMAFFREVDRLRAADCGTKFKGHSLLPDAGPAQGPARASAGRRRCGGVRGPALPPGRLRLRYVHGRGAKGFAAPLELGKGVGARRSSGPAASAGSLIAEGSPPPPHHPPVQARESCVKCGRVPAGPRWRWGRQWRAGLKSRGSLRRPGMWMQGSNNAPKILLSLSLL